MLRSGAGPRRCSCPTPGPQRTRELPILGPPPAHATARPVHLSPSTSIQTRVDYSINSYIKLIAILMPLLTPFTVTHSDRVISADCVSKRGNKYSEKWICFTKCLVGLQNILNKFKNVFVCFRVLNLLLWDYLCMCMKSCLVNPSAFEVLVIQKSMEMNDVFCPILLYLQMKRSMEVRG